VAVNDSHRLGVIAFSQHYCTVVMVDSTAVPEARHIVEQFVGGNCGC
jgi:hypothetical protein